MTAMMPSPSGSPPGSPLPPGGDALPPPPPAALRKRPLANGRWQLRPRGVWLVTALELKQRLRSLRWYIALGVWTLVLLGIGLLALGPVMYIGSWEDVRVTARVLFSLQMILVLFAMLLVVPALSAGSINGDRTAGTLATLQVSLLSPAELVLGKLLAGFATGLAFQVLALPSVVPLALLGQVGIFYMLRLVLVLSLLTLCVTSIGLGLSALTARQLGSVVLMYALVFGVTAVAPITWATSAAFLQYDTTVQTYSGTYDSSSDRWICEPQMRERRVVRADLSLPLMWANPVVLLAEAAPRVNADTYASEGPGMDALVLLKAGMRTVATSNHPSRRVNCSPEDSGYPEHLGTPPNRPLWPMGMAMWMLAGGGSLVLAVHRIGVPIGRLGKGTRIA